MTLHELVEPIIRAAHGDRVTLGNVEFWIDASGPWAGQLSYDVPTTEWDRASIESDILHRLQPVS